MPAFTRQPARAALALGLSLFLLDLGSCSSSSSSTTTTPAAPISLTAASAALQSKVTTEAPRVVNSSVVTGLADHHLLPSHWAGHLGLISEAFADDLSLSTIWDPESGSAPTGSDFALVNLYIGGGFTPDPSSNTCTKGSVTVPCLESLKDFMGQALDPEFQNSNGASTTLFGRLQFTSQLLCAMGQLVPAGDVDTDGLPKVGDLTLDFPTDTTNILYQPVSAGGCGISTSDAGGTAAGTVAAVTSANYTKQLSLMVGGNQINVWLKLDSAAGVYNVMSLEDQRPQGRDAVDRAIANISGLNTPGGSTVLFEYISIGSATSDNTSCYANGGWQCSYEYHRVVIDEAANQAYVVSNFGDPGATDGSAGAPTRYLQFTGAAEPSVLQTCEAGSSCSGTLALSFTADGQQSPGGTVYPSAGNAYNGCINIDDRSIATDGSLACDLTGASILASGGASAMIEATREVYAADVVSTLLANTTAATTLAFTGASDIYTAANTQ